MPKREEFLLCLGNTVADASFLLEFQRCVLLELKQKGLLDQEQLEACVIRLGQQEQ